MKQNKFIQNKESLLTFAKRSVCYEKSILKLFALLLIFTMLVVPVSAGGSDANLPDEHEHEIVKTSEVNNDDIMPCSFECEACGEGIMEYYETISDDWEHVADVTCQYGYSTHNGQYMDKIVILKYKCNACKIVDTDITVYSKTVCPINP